LPAKSFSIPWGCGKTGSAEPVTESVNMIAIRTSSLTALGLVCDGVPGDEAAADDRGCLAFDPRLAFFLLDPLPFIITPQLNGLE